MALADTLLVTAADLAAFQRGEVKALDDDQTYALGFIAAAQEGLRAYLGYDPFVHRTVRFRPAWGMEGGFPSEFVPWIALGTGGPVVQVVSAPYVPSGQASDYYTTAISADGFSVEVDTADPLPTVLDLYEGWRSSAHVLSSAGQGETALTSLPGLSGLTALPPEAPHAVKATICAVALYLARYATAVGQESYTVDLGAQVKTVETVRPLNDVNVLIGRTSEVQAIYAQCHRYRRAYA